MQPFSDIRVIDLTHVIAGPFSTYQLAVMGAEVIKIESPKQPDIMREEGSDLTMSEDRYGTVFQTQNANKKSVVINLKTEEGISVIKKLIATADVFVENYRAGALTKLGIGYDDVKRIKPDIIYCSLTGFGQSGPLSERTAYDNVIQAMSGLMASTGFTDGEAVKVGPPVLDYGTGIQAAFAIAAALYQRKNDGLGQYIDIAMLDAALMLSSTNITHSDHTQSPPYLHGNNSLSHAGYGCYETQSGQIMIGAYTADQVANAWDVMGNKEYGATFRGRPNYKMIDSVKSDKQKIADIMQTKTAAEWEILFNEAKVPAAEVRSTDQTLNHPHIKHRKVIQHIEVNGKSTALPTAAFSFDHDGPKVTSVPPTLGEHTEEILTAVGFSESELAQYQTDGVIICKHSNSK